MFANCFLILIVRSKSPLNLILFCKKVSFSYCIFFQSLDLKCCYLTFLIQPLTIISKGRPHYQLTPENKTFPGSFEWAPAGTGSLRPTSQSWSKLSVGSYFNLCDLGPHASHSCEERFALFLHKAAIVWLDIRGKKSTMWTIMFSEIFPTLLVKEEMKFRRNLWTDVEFEKTFL